MLSTLLVAASTAAISCGLPFTVFYCTPLAKKVHESGPFDSITRRLLLTVTTLLVWILLVGVAVHEFKPWAYHGVLLGFLPLAAFGVGWTLRWLGYAMRNLLQAPQPQGSVR